MGRTFTRDGEQLTCEIRPASAGAGFDFVCTQDGEDHIEHYLLESQAEARIRRVADDLLHDGWSPTQ